MFLIRRNMQAIGQPVRIDTIRREAQRSSTIESSPLADPKNVPRHTEWDDHLPRMEGVQDMPRGQTRSQVIMKTYGWPIKRAMAPLEMVCAMRDAIAGEPFPEPTVSMPLTRHISGHHNAYKAGILHRDISIGNIIITANPTPNNRGALIDFDNAVRYSDDRVPVLHDPLTVNFIGLSYAQPLKA